MNDIQLVDYSDINSLEEFGQAVGSANVVFAINKADKTQRGLVWGASLLRAIVQEIIPAQEMKTIGFLVDFDTLELEHIHAAIEVLKGCHDGTFSSEE